ncbi:putative acetyltransferase [Georgenia muralis]
MTSDQPHDAGQAPPPLPWMAWRPGERVVVRYRAPDGVHDALGDLLEVTPDAVVVQTRRGAVRVAAATMITGKRVPPPPGR